jgi:signal transduction histidine kinase/CheY-like chemotaxis protein/ligand-binding sensor domain-containing protein
MRNNAGSAYRLPFFALVVACLATTNPGFAISRQESLSSLIVSHWSASSGLPEETFASILATGDGYVWIASNNGLVRFDSTRAEVFRLGSAYRASGTGSCSTSTLSTLLLSKDNSIWVGSSSGCIFRILRDHFGSFANFRLQAISAPDSMREPNATIALNNHLNNTGVQVVRRSGTAFLASFPNLPSGSLASTNLKATPSEEKRETALPSGLQILFSSYEPSGRLWAIFSDLGLYSSLPGSGKWQMEWKLSVTPRRMIADGQGGVWIATSKGAVHWKPGSERWWTMANGLPNNDVSSLHQGRDACVWLGLSQSVARICGESLEAITVGQRQEEILSSITEDPQGNLWMGGRWGNLYRLSTGAFRSYTQAEGLPESHLTGVTIDQAGDTWGSLRSSGLVRLSQGKLVATYPQPEIAEVQAMVPHPAGGVIAATSRALSVASKAGVRPLKTATKVPSWGLAALFAPSSDTLLYSNSIANHRLRGQNIGTASELWQIESLEGPVRIRQWAQDSSSVIWAIAQHGGLFRLESNAYRPAPNANSDRVRNWYSLYLDSEGLLWIGSSDGMDVYSTRETRFLTASPLLANDQIFHLTQDRFGKIWCSTRQGLLRFSRKSALEAITAKSASLLVERFTEAQSLPTTNFGLVTSASGATGPDGRLWFPGLLGLVSLNPADFERAPRPPLPILLTVQSDGTPKDFNINQNIAPGTKKVEFAFRAIRLDTLGGDFCRLRMIGFDPTWIPCNESRTAQYTNLSPGPYELLIQTSSQADSWNGTVLRIPFTMEAAFHQQLAVRLLALCLVALGLGAFFRRRHMQSQRRTRLLEEKVEERTTELESAMRDAQSANLAKTEFLATMSHEIRTPMNGVLGAVQLLSVSSLNEDQSKLVSVIRKSGEDLIGIVDDILSLSKVEAGKLTLEKAPVDLALLCENLIDLFRPKAQSKGVELAWSMDQAVPSAILTDPQRLRQILLNLIGNAVKFTEVGKVNLRISTSEAKITFHIEDTGMGIPAEKIPTLFDPFVQADSSTTRRFGGSGLGLAIVSRFVSAMQGSIEVVSTPGQGSTFRFHLPLEVATIAPVAPKPSAIAMASGITVLLAEDNPVNQMVFLRMLERLGCQVKTATNGQEALSILGQNTVDVVLMDCQMPLLDGYEATQAIRSWGGTFTDLPIIALTASAMESDRQRCFSVGMNDFLSKPLVMANLEQKLAQWGAKEKSHP